MKFGKSFEQRLEEENFPKEWVSASIQYKQLKVHHSLIKAVDMLTSRLEMYKQGMG